MALYKYCASAALVEPNLSRVSGRSSRLGSDAFSLRPPVSTDR